MFLRKHFKKNKVINGSMSVSDEFGWTVLSILASAALSGLLGVWISNRSYKLNEIRRLKLKVLQQLMANRFSKNSQGFVEAMNQIPIVYYESKEVLSHLKCITNTACLLLQEM